MRIERELELDFARPFRAMRLEKGWLEIWRSEWAAQIPVEYDDGDVDGPVHPMALHLAEMLGEKVIRCREQSVAVQEIAFPRRADPSSTLSYEQRRNRMLEKQGGSNVVGVSVPRLMEVARALGAGRVALEIRPLPHPILVRRWDWTGEGSEALLMPLVRVDEAP